MTMPASIRLALAVKRTADVLVAVLALVLLAPLMACIVVAIKLEDPHSPLFFNDWVMGRGLTQFRMLKFRTMVPHEINYTERPEVHRGSPLVTRVGVVLRRWKLDELPQLLNVLFGQMSVVGPRPMDPVRFEHSTAFQRQRLLVRPGLTGWAQINGNIHWSWDERIEMDVWYLDQWSLARDFGILCATVPSIIKGERRLASMPSRISDDTYRVSWPGSGRFKPRTSSDPVTNAP